MIRRDLMVVLAAFPLAANAYDSLGSSSSHPCPEGHLPAICCFEPKRDGFVATLCGLHSEEWNVVERRAGGTVTPENRERDRPRVEYGAAVGWRSLPAVPPPGTCGNPPGADSSSILGGTARGCPDALLAALPVLTKEGFRRLRPGAGGDGSGKQATGGGCVQSGGYLWFGAGFYDGEGYTGVGGIGRFDPRTNDLEIRRLPALRDFSAAALLHDGTWLWLGTYRNGEGGDEPAIGVVRYDWAKDDLVAEPDAMCGFLATGMVQLAGALWLASDGGLSRRDARGRWEHFVFREVAPPRLERVTCGRVYALARKTTVGAEDRQEFDKQIKQYRKSQGRVRSGQ